MTRETRRTTSLSRTRSKDGQRLCGLTLSCSLLEIASTSRCSQPAPMPHRVMPMTGHCPSGELGGAAEGTVVTRIWPSSRVTMDRTTASPSPSTARSTTRAFFRTAPAQSSRSCPSPTSPSSRGARRRPCDHGARGVVRRPRPDLRCAGHLRQRARHWPSGTDSRALRDHGPGRSVLADRWPARDQLDACTVTERTSGTIVRRPHGAAPWCSRQCVGAGLPTRQTLEATSRRSTVASAPPPASPPTTRPSPTRSSAVSSTVASRRPRRERRPQPHRPSRRRAGRHAGTHRHRGTTTASVTRLGSSGARCAARTTGHRSP
jgi:hypothetical protein